MTSRLVRLGFLSLFCILPYSQEVLAQPKTSEILSLLDEPISMKDFQNPMKLKEFLGIIYDTFAAKGKDLPISIDLKAFKRAYPENRLDPYEADINFNQQFHIKRLAISTVLEWTLTQIPSADMTYLVRNSMVEILPASLATPQALLQTRIRGDFKGAPLKDILQEFSYQTGATIALDPQVGDKAKSLLTLKLQNDVTLETALAMVAEMAELKSVVLAGGPFLTTPDRAALLAKERPVLDKLQTKVRGDFNNVPIDQVLRDLSNQIGATIALDPNMREESKAPITATFRNDVSLEAALRIVTEMAELKLVVLSGGPFVTTPERAAVLLKEKPALEKLQSKFRGMFNNPLEQVLQEISFKTGLSIVLDPNVKDKAHAHIRANFRNDVTLETALRMVAEMADLKLVLMSGGPFVTTAERAEKLQAKDKK